MLFRLAYCCMGCLGSDQRQRFNIVSLLYLIVAAIFLIIPEKDNHYLSLSLKRLSVILLLSLRGIWFMSLSGVRETVRDLVSLSKRDSLPGADLQRAKQLMRSLRRLGFTNQDVSRLVKGRWGASTVKLYTKGVKVEDSNLYEKIMSIVSDLILKGHDLEDVESFLKQSEAVESNGSSFDEISGLLAICKEQTVEVKDLIAFYRDVKTLGLTMPKAKTYMSNWGTLDARGITVENLSLLVEASEKVGGFTKVMKSIEAFGELEKIQAAKETVADEVEELDRRKKGLISEVADLDRRFKELTAKNKAVTDSLKTFSGLVEQGLTEEVMKNIMETLTRFGDVNKVLSAVNSYSGLKNLESEMVKTGEELAALKTEISSLQPVAKLCNALTVEHGFSVDTVSKLCKLAAVHGKPSGVITALTTYNSLKAIQSEVKRLESVKSSREAEVEELESNVTDLRGEVSAVKHSVEEALKPLPEEVRRSVAALDKAAVDALNGLTEKYGAHLASMEKEYNDYVKRFGELKAEAGKLEEELNLARVVSSLIRYPSEAKDLPFNYAILLQEAVEKFCLAKGVNSKIRLGGGPHSGQQLEVDLMSLILYVKNGLKTVGSGVALK